MVLERNRLTVEDMSDYLKVKDEYNKDEVLLALDVGDFKLMPYVYLDTMMLSLVGEDRNILRGRGENNKHYKVSELYESLGKAKLFIRLEDLIEETAGRVGIVVAGMMHHSNFATSRRVSAQTLGDIQDIIERFYSDITDRKKLTDKAYQEFRKAYITQMTRYGEMSDRVMLLLDYVETQFYGDSGYNNTK